MPPDNKPEDKAFHWRREDAYIEVTSTEFAKLITENGITPQGPFGGYWYGMKHTTEGEELYRVVAAGGVWWAWTYKQVCTQDNAAGGTLRIDVTPATGQVVRIAYGNMAASGTRAAAAFVRDSANATKVTIDAVAAAAGATATWPKAATANGTTAGAIDSKDMNMYPTDYFSTQVTSAAQTETATVNFTMLLSSPTVPTISWANSGGTPNAAAASINTVTAVAMP